MYQIDDILASKLASIVVHADEVVRFGSASTLQLIQLKTLIDSPEVQNFITRVGPLAPVPRR